MAGKKIKIGLTRDFFDNEGEFEVPGGLRLLDEMPNTEYVMLDEFLEEVSPEQIRAFDVVVSLRPSWTRQSIAGNEQLLCVLRSGVGYDNIDVPALTSAGVMLCTTPRAMRRSMAVAAITFLLVLSMRFSDKYKLIRDGQWTKTIWAERAKYCGYGLTGKMLGSVGIGSIGHEMFLLAKPFSMKHIAYDPYANQGAVDDVGVELVDLNTVLSESDYLTIACPLTEETYHLIGEKELKKMKKTAFLINIARGHIIDEAALIKALQEDWIRGVGIDVFEQEPTSPDNPLLKMDNVVATPHIMGWTDELTLSKWDANIGQILQIIRGEIPNSLVNREVLNRPELQAKLEKFQESLK